MTGHTSLDDDVMPNPPAWPACSTCSTAWVLRRSLSLSAGYLWLWQRDCRHRTAEPVAFGPDGPLKDGVLPDDTTVPTEGPTP